MEEKNEKTDGDDLMLAMLLTCAAFAEEEEEDYAPMPEEAAVYEGKWACEQAGIEIFWEEVGFRVSIRWESTEWGYSCHYIEKDNTLISMPTGSRTEIVYNEAGDVESFHDVYNDGSAIFALDEEGYLIWRDEKEDAGKDMRFEKVDRYSGTWVCGRASMEVDLEDGGYKVFITWPSSAAEVTEWEYGCLMDYINDALEAMPFGVCTKLVYGENGEIVSANVIYEDGEASFSLDEEGYLLWRDAKEDAGKEMRFERVEIVPVEDPGI